MNLLNEESEIQDSVLVYSHELFLTEKSNLEVTVKQSYFKGNTFLVKGVYDRKIVFFENPFPLNDGENVFLTVDPEILDYRS